MRLVLFAMESAYAAAALRRLSCSSGVETLALVVPPSAPPGFPAVRTDRTVNARMAGTSGIRMIPHHDDDDLVERLWALAPDVVALACYPRRISERIAAVPRLACVNLHPSLLPAYRGPDPLFWQLRAGERRTGVTVHRVEARLDAGALLASRFVALPPGWRRRSLDDLLGDAAAELLVDRLRCRGAPVFEPQDESLATEQPMPTAADRVVGTDWPVGRAWNFLRGAAPEGSVFQVTDGHATVAVRDVLGLDDTPLAELTVDADGSVVAGFAGGTIRASRA